jgi:hypothetical protein
MATDDRKHVRFTMLPGSAAATPEGLIALFEWIKQRPATPQELAEFEAGKHRLKLPPEAP